jgi:hypothetical protein
MSLTFILSSGWQPLPTRNYVSVYSVCHPHFLNVVNVFLIETGTSYGIQSIAYFPSGRRYRLVITAWSVDRQNSWRHFIIGTRLVFDGVDLDTPIDSLKSAIEADAWVVEEAPLTFQGCVDWILEKYAEVSVI